jgi:hypothetical protein
MAGPRFYSCFHQIAGKSPCIDGCNGAIEEKLLVRKFDTGATRDTDKDKLDYEAFFSPVVLERRAQFMHKHRIQPDGSLRDGDNWKKGIPIRQYMKSCFRHQMDIWKELHGHKTAEGLEEAICAAMFNLEGMLYEVLKTKAKPHVKLSSGTINEP